MPAQAPYRLNAFHPAGTAHALAEAARILRDAGLEEARSDARLLLLAATGLSPVSLTTEPDQPLDRNAAALFKSYIARRLEREPVSRILGRRAFWKSEFKVTPAVLDPRADTETIIEAALDRLADRRNAPLRIVDLGTGSGAIICSLLLEFPNARGTACDISPEALEVARDNARLAGVENRLALQLSDWARLAAAQWDVIVSNPPYIATALIADLDREVRLFDPQQALDGGADGLDAYRSLADFIRPQLAPGGWAFLEVGYDQAGSVAALFKQNGSRVAGFRADAAGIDRVVEIETI